MLPYERKMKLLKYITDRHSATIVELSRFLGVSDMTVRRDLAELEKESLVVRTHGGAVAPHSGGVEPKYEAKTDVHSEQKERIAAFVASRFVQSGDVLFLEGGTTVTAMAKHLAGYDGLTVATNGIHTAVELRNLSREHTVLCSGGMLRDVSMTMVGPQAERYFGELHARTAFLSAQGLTEAQGFTDPNLLEVQVKRAMRAAAKRTVMLIDSAKLSTVSVMTSFALNDIDVVVTDPDAPRETLERLKERGLDILIAE